MDIVLKGLSKVEDYKELIALLDGAMVMTTSNGKIEKAELFCKAADAIEQLVKERDYYEACADEVWDCCTNRKACIAMEKIKKERNAAIADLRGFCGVCKFARNLSDNPFEDSKEECFCCNGDKWEWRGVQEVIG